MAESQTLPARFEIPKDYIEKVITAEIAKALGDPAPIIERFVRMCLEQKKDTWSSDTFFTQTVRESVQEATKIAFKEWLDENQTEVTKAVKKYVSAKSGLMDNLVKQILEAMAQRIYISVNIDSKDREIR